jgi:hypothetical protein
VTWPRLFSLVVLGLLDARPGLALPPPDAPPILRALSRRDQELELVLGVRGERSRVHSEVAGFLALNVPLERALSPRAVIATAEPTARVPDGEAGPSAEPAGGDELTPQVPDELSSSSGRTHPRLGPELLSPLARGVVAAARKRAHLHESERAQSSLSARARWSAVLRDLRVRVARTRDETLRLTPTIDDPNRFALAGGDALVLEGTATFKLGRLVFADEELAVERLRLERGRVAERLRARVLDRLFAWYSALSRLETADAEERPRLEIERLSAEAELDVLTGGWFGERLLELGIGPEASAGRNRTGSGTRAVASATPTKSCLPKRETGSPTSCGASMR